MPDPDVLLNVDPQGSPDNTGATTIGAAPVSITSALDNYANQPGLPADTLGLLMTDQQKFDADLHPEPLGTLPPSSVIDATGGADSAANTASGYAQAIGLTKDMVSGAHTGAAWLARAAGAAKDDPMVKGLGTLNKIYAVPFGAAAAIANASTDMQNGATVGDALVGNAIRGVAVTGAGMIPYAGPVAALAANKYLPDGAAIGHAYHQSFVDTGGRALLLP